MQAEIQNSNVEILATHVSVLRCRLHFGAATHERQQGGVKVPSLIQPKTSVFVVVGVVLMWQVEGLGFSKMWQIPSLFLSIFCLLQLRARCRCFSKNFLILWSLPL